MELLEQQLADLSPAQRELVERWLRQKQAEVIIAPEPGRIPRRASNGAAPLSFAQQRLWFLSRLEPDNPAYNVRIAVHLSGRLDLATLERSLNEIGRRHEVLRTVFVEVKGQPAQVVVPSVSFPLSLVDLSSLSRAESDARVEQLALAAIEQPFDLEHGPLLRASVLRIGAEAYVLLLILHHTVADAWSQGVLLGELAALYSAFLEGKPSPLPELPLQYADFALWQREWLQGQVLDEQLAYWKQQLEHAPHMLELPSDRPHPPTSTHRGAVHHFRLAAPLAEKLSGLCRREGVTLFMTLLTAFNVLLHRYTGQTDLVVGSPIAGRNRHELEGLIGCFINMLVLRAKLAGDPPFTAALRQVRDVTLGAYAHQDLPFEKLVEVLQPARDLSRHPLFQVMFNFQNTPSPTLKRPGLTISLMELSSRTSRFDLAVFLRETNRGLEGRIEYSTDLFEAPSIQRLVQHFETLLEGIVAQPQQRIDELPLLNGVERQQLLVEWNDTATGYGVQGPGDRTIHALFEAQAARTPDAVALVFETNDARCPEGAQTNDERGRGEACLTPGTGGACPARTQHLTYGELNARANQLAHHLRALGVGPDVPVAIRVERSLELVVGLLGVLKAGGAYLPLEPSYPAERIGFMLADSGAAVVLVATNELSDKEKGRARERENGTLPFSPSPLLPFSESVVDLAADWPAIARHPTTPPGSGVSADNLAYIIYTSGSTGRPKGAMLAHRGVANRLLWMQQTYRLAADDRVLQKTPFSFDVSVWEFFWPLASGASLVLAQPEGHKDPAYLTRLIARERISTLHFVPPMLRAFLAEPALASCASLRHVFCSGEALAFDLQERFFARLGAELHNLYGPTEASVDVSSWACERASARGRVPIGRPVANTQLYVLDRRLNPTPLGAVGELYIGGVQLARGYLGRPDLTATAFMPNPFATNDERRTTNADLDPSSLVVGRWPFDSRLSAIGYRLYRTGDQARFLPDGAIEYLGRLDQQIKLRGYRIELGEVETALAEHARVREAVVLTREDRAGDARLVAYIVPTNEERPIIDDRRLTIDDERYSEPSSIVHRPSSLTSELRSFLQKRLPDYMLPSAFVVLDALPLSTNGKVDRRALPPPAQSGAAPGEAFIPPRDTLELCLLRIWEEVLTARPIGIRDNFLDLGGHSLLAVSLLARIQQLTDRQLPLATIFQAPTVEQQAALLRQTAPPAWSALVPLQPSGSARPFFCVHPAGGNITGFFQLSRHLGDDQPFYGLQAPGLDGGRAPFTQIEPMAAYYVEELRRLQPDGPYLLGGWSIGGVVAFEMAQQLRRQGQTVALLALFDAPARGLDEHRPHPASFIDMFAQDLGRRLNKEIPLLPPVFDTPDVDRQLGWILDRAQRENLLPMSIGLTELRQLFEVFEANMQARDSYTPQVYADRVALFRASESLRNRPIGMDLGWRALVPDGLTIQIVPGDHYTMLQEPQVRTLAQWLKASIDESLDPRAQTRAAQTSEQAAITLLSPAGAQEIDTLLREIVGRYEAAFPSRIRACYLTGSYAVGGTVPDSDIDMIVVFTGSTIDDEEQERALEVYKSCSLLTARDVSIDVLPEADLFSHINVFKAMTVKTAATLIYGEDIGDAISMPPADLYTRATMDAAFFHTAQIPLVPFPILSRLRRVGGSVVFPLDYPDPTGEFYGYDLYRGSHDSVCGGTKALVKLTREMARALVARAAGPDTAVTREYARTYRECVGGEWAELIEELYEACKLQWHYELPTDPRDRRKLRELCRQTLAFENHFLATYRDHLLGELERAEEEHVVHAVHKLGESVYPDDQIIPRLDELAARSSTAVREAIAKTKKRIAKASARRGIADPASAAQMPVDSSRWAAYAGMYRGETTIGTITASVHVGEGLLWIYVPALAAKIPCSPFDDRCFDCIYGFIEFQEMEDGAPQTMTVDITGGKDVTFTKQS